MRNPSFTSFLSLLAVAALAVCVPQARAERAGAPTLAVLPLQVYNAPDLAPSAPGLQAALASRLALPGYRVLTPAGGEAAEADWSVRTTITRLGTRVTLDGALEAKGGAAETVRRAFQTADSADGLLPALEALASTLREGLPGAPQLPAPLPPPGAAASAPPPAAQAPAATPVAAAPAPGSPSAAGPGPAFARYRLGAPFAGETRSLVVADLDRDGSPEILALVDRRLVALRDDGREPTILWELPLPGGAAPALLSVGDVDHDGVPELFVAGLRDKTPFTQAYQWEGGALVAHGPEFAAFARAVVHPDRGLLLLGMLPGQNQDLFAPTQRSFTWDGGAYRPTEPFPAPNGTSVLNMDWFRASEGAEPLMVATTQAGALRLYNAAGRVLFESPDPLKGSRNVLVGREHGRDSGDADLFPIEGKTLAWRADDGTTHLLLHRNLGTLARLFRQSATFTHGQCLSFRWDGLTLLPTGEGPKVSGFFTDLDLGPTPGNPGRRTLYAPLVQAEGVFSLTYTTRLVAMDL